MARVFVSHADSDAELADQVYRTLADLGHRAFLARDLRTGTRPGDVWKERLHQELRAADAVICVVTDAYNASPWCAYEIGIAHEVGSLLLPLQAQSGVASPLLAFSLHELARNQLRGGRLAARRYEELGGVRGALARRADAVLDEAVAAAGLPREDILAGMAELATLDEVGRRTRRRIDDNAADLDATGRHNVDACSAEDDKEAVRDDRDQNRDRDDDDVPAAGPPAIGRPLTGHTGSLLSLAFSPDSKLLASGGNDGTIRLWLLDAVDALQDTDATEHHTQVVDDACAIAGGLDRSSWQYYLPGVPYRVTCPS